MIPWTGNISKGLSQTETHDEEAKSMIRVKEEDNDGEFHVLSYTRHRLRGPELGMGTSVIVIDARRAEECRDMTVTTIPYTD